jgi:EAL domain-containing protein (putative c-di-GMP-specific phosphodiesterase class I)
LIPEAEQALDEARQRGMESIAFHTGRRSEGLMSLSSQLNRAVERDEFELLFQPIFAFHGDPSGPDPLAGARVVGAEALLRWNHPQRGLLTPDAFIDILESMSLGEAVGALVIQKACRQARLWADAGFPISVWINAFARQVLSHDFIGSLSGAIMEHGVDPRLIVVELLERLVSHDHGRITRTVANIRQTGVRIAIDDFGTGHSSLARLREVTFDILKIDRSFISSMDTDEKSQEVVAMLSGLARELGVETVAEGVETIGQLRFVQQRYAYMQGYLLALPMLPAEIEPFLRRINGGRSYESRFAG